MARLVAGRGDVGQGPVRTVVKNKLMSTRRLCFVAIVVAGVALAAQTAQGADEVVLEASGGASDLTTDYEAVAKHLLQEATKNANLRRALANPSLSVSLYVGDAVPCIARATMGCDPRTVQTA
jgi:hypothetical protein